MGTASCLLSDDEYDIISNPGQRSLDSSIADIEPLTRKISPEVYEPLPSQAAHEKFETIRWTAEDVQAFVRQSLDANPTHKSKASTLKYGTVCIYVDGIFDGFNVGHALQLRQAKLSFPSVYLMVGVLMDESITLHGCSASIPHVERCEIVRHCRWVDEVVAEAPWVVDKQFLDRHYIDVIAIDEGTSVDPGCDKARVRGYDDMKILGKVIQTRRTVGLTLPGLPYTTSPTPIPSTIMLTVPAPGVKFHEEGELKGCSLAKSG